MFEIGWSELLILGVVTLIFVGPKELPALMRTVGRYAGSIKRHANEFKAHFEDAMRQMELDEMRKEMEAMQASVNSEIMKASSAIEETAKGTPNKPDTSAATSAAASSATPAIASDMPPMPAPPGKEA